jgi:hypothetical protein
MSCESAQGQKDVWPVLDRPVAEHSLSEQEHLETLTP